MPRPTHRLRRAALALAIGLAAAADAQPARPPAPDLGERVQRAVSALDLTAAQRSALDAVAARHAGPQPGALWAAAAEVEAVLTDAQVARLRDGLAARRGDRPRGTRDLHRGRTGVHAGHPARRGTRERLTDEQRQAVREVRDDVRPRLQALRERLRAGEISDEAYGEQARALRDEAAARVEAVLPAEVRARREAAEARREAERAARERALGLTEAQKAAARALAAERVRTAPERPDLRPFLDESGRLDRQAFREARRAERREALANRPSLRERADAVLTADQRDVLTVYRALAGGGPDGGRRGRRGGPE